MVPKLKDKMKYIKLLSELTIKDISKAGGKGASLGEMTRAGINVPSGFVILADACRDFYQKEMPESFIVEVMRAFDLLDVNRVAVRSSAIAEDSSTASWAGQLESYLNVSRKDVLDSVKKCWESVFTERAIEYAKEQSASEDDLVVAVVVQRMVDSKISGVMFSVNPVSKNHDEIMIESTFGLGEMLVQGMVTPDNFVIDKNTFQILEENIQTKLIEYIFKDGKNIEADVDLARASKPTLNEEEIRSLAEQAIIIEKHYAKPQDIEWGIQNGEIYILQSRPIIGL